MRPPSPSPRSRGRILVADRYTEEGLQILGAGGEFDVQYEPEITPERLAEVIEDIDALVIRSRCRVTGDTLARGERLKVIGRAGVGLDNVDVGAATERGVIVMNTPEGNTLSTAEHAISMMLALVRRIPQADATMKQGRWDKGAFTGSELHGKTLGIIGLGKVGSAVGARMAAFGMRIVGYDPYVTHAVAERVGVEKVEIDELCRRADVITIHAPLNKETRGLINARRLSLMKPAVFLVNCARGGIVDEAALIDSLRSGRLAGAALDVFDAEPLPADHPLRGLENVVLTPHVAASTTEAQGKVASEVARQVVEALRGGMIRNAVNAPSLDPLQAERLAPAMDLAERLGKFMSRFCPAPVERIEVLYSGTLAEPPLAPTTTALIKGYLLPQLNTSVNFVNAPFLAKSRGIEVVESSSTETYDYSGLITVKCRSANGEENAISGTLFRGGRPRLVMVNGKHCDVTPEGHMLVIQNRDVPGIIGAVGTALGRARINIADMTWGREGASNEATTVINVDEEVPPAVLEEIRSIENILSVQSILI